MKLDFAIIGGQKCGSTYLHHIIDEHPDIEMVPGESPEFEDPDYENGGLEKLKAKINVLDQTKIIGIKRPNYLCKQEVPERLFKANPNMKLIVILRNPIERFKSSYFHQMNNGFCPILEMNEAVQKILDNKFREEYPRSENILNFGLYGHFLKQYLKKFNSNILVLTFDELKENKEQLIKKCYAFLGVDENYAPTKEINKKPQRVNYSIQRAKFLIRSNKYRYYYNENKTRLFLKKQTIWDIFNYALIRAIDRFFLELIIGNKKPKLSAENKMRLLEFYKNDISKLEEEIGKDLKSWKK